MEKLHYKMYKDGKKWVFAAITVVALGVGLSEGTYNIKADSNSTVTNESAVNGSSATNVDSTNGSAANSSSATNVIKRTVNIAKLTRHFTQLKTNKASKTNTDNEALPHVAKDTFLDYFSLNGSATYDKNSGIVTITPDEYNKVGNFSLKSKIDMSTSFTLTGQVNLGSNPNGADGIGFAFHNGNTTDIGNAGSNFFIFSINKCAIWSIHRIPIPTKIIRVS